MDETGLLAGVCETVAVIGKNLMARTKTHSRLLSWWYSTAYDMELDSPSALHA